MPLRTSSGTSEGFFVSALWTVFADGFGEATGEGGLRPALSVFAGSLDGAARFAKIERNASEKDPESSFSSSPSGAGFFRKSSSTCRRGIVYLARDSVRRSGHDTLFRSGSGSARAKNGRERIASIESIITNSLSPSPKLLRRDIRIEHSFKQGRIS